LDQPVPKGLKVFRAQRGQLDLKVFRARLGRLDLREIPDQMALEANKDLLDLPAQTEQTA
jgi:hypothetical protein